MPVDIPGLGLSAAEGNGERFTDVQFWDDASRPSRRVLVGYAYTSRGRAAATSLLHAHAELREAMERVRALRTRVAAAKAVPNAGDRWGLDAAAARQNYWALGSQIVASCNLVTQHHFGEDDHIFPLLRGKEAALDQVIDRLTDEHHVIHDLVSALDRDLVALVGFEGTVDAVSHSVDVLSDALVSHLAYEEQQLLEAMARYFG